MNALTIIVNIIFKATMTLIIIVGMLAILHYIWRVFDAL